MAFFMDDVVAPGPHAACPRCREIFPLPASTEPEGIDATLAERGSRYGSFTEHARITQAIKRAMADSPNWEKLADDQREALEMVAHKAGRILNGDPDFHDSWYDIIGYVKLVADRLRPS